MLRLFIWLTLGAWAVGKAVPSLAAEGEELLGRRAPEWNAVDWLQSEPLRLADLRGQVVLIRWWTDSCPMCARSAPALNEFHDLYSKRGLVVIGMYHPKPSTRQVSSEELQKVVEQRGFQFPIGLDLDWSNLRKFWLDGGRRRATSVSFLIDRQGRIRHIHPGPEFHKQGQGEHARCRFEYLELQHRIVELLYDPLLGGEK